MWFVFALMSAIFAALTSGISGKDALMQQLVRMYPKKKIVIEQVFNRYR